ncbi:hypothetical protein CDEST_13973 [Colletotrichum destructivum]|uniref:Uncharacterized protein n=1 Tax=Colletotrichum destructivum TaxID=34406 RepID=A0AAX4J082_9PEZI|nr:hypothetical protein CDEST_13973 [Colletotrichum destructivum]
MSVILYVQQELKEHLDDEIGFQALEDTHPCTACVGSLHRHIFLRCCEAEVVGPCILCGREGNECTAIPVELLSTAQTIWNYAKVIADKHEEGDLDGVQRWRSHRALERACTAWNELLAFLEQPVDFGGLSLDVVQTHEAAMMREMTIIGLLHKSHASLPHQFSFSLAGIIPSTEELLARLVALAPPWSQHKEPARKLRDAVRDLNVAKDVPASGVAQEGSISKFPQLIAAEVVGELSTVHWAIAPVLDVRYPSVRLRICEETLNEHQAWRGGFVDADTPEDSDQEAPADQGAPAVSKGGDELENADDHEKPIGSVQEQKHEHEIQSVSGPESPKEPAKPKHAMPADGNLSKNAVTAGKTAPKSNSPNKLGHKSNSSMDKNNDDVDDDDGREKEEEDTGGEARPGPLTRPRKRRAPADEEDTGNSAGKPRKRTRALKKIAVKN